MAKGSENSTAEIILLLFGMSFVGALVYEFLIYPVCWFVFGLDSEGFFLDGPSFTWGKFLAGFIGTFVLLLMSAFCGSGNDNNQKARRHNSRTSYHSSKETDYYDEDMEGAPGYYGED